MAFDGNGNYQLPSPEFPFIPDTPIVAEDMNNVLADMGSVLSRVLLRDGTSLPIAPITWNGQKLIGLANGTIDSDAVNFGQVFKSPTLTSPKLAASPAFDDSSLLIPSTEWVRNLAFSSVLPGQIPGVAGFFLSTTGAAAQWTSIDGRGVKNLVGGNASGTKILNYRDGETQSYTITAATIFDASVATANWPAARTAAMMVVLTNAGAFPTSFVGVVWIKPDGSETNNFADLGVSFQTAGRDRVVIVAEPGLTPWAKVVR